MMTLPSRIEAVNLGLATFADALADQGVGVVSVDWRPPAGGDPRALAALTRLWGVHGSRVAEANAKALEAIESAQPRATDVRPAGEVMPVLGERTLLHSGPPIEWERICEPQRRALTAACVFEQWAADPTEARALLAAGAVGLASGNEHGHVGPMTGVCSPSMPVWVVEDAGTRAYSTLNEGPGETLWFGVCSETANARLRFFRDELGPHLASLLRRHGPIDVFGLAAQGLHMGDELHMRSQATGHLLARELLADFAALGGEASARFLAGNHHFFLTLTMAAAKCASLAASGTQDSSLVSLISRNGTDVGVQLAGLPGRWFTAPAAPVADALLREGYKEDDAALDIGDSAVIECVGLGGMALAASPAVAGFFGGNAQDAVGRTRHMGEICAGSSRRFTIPALDGGGSPVGIDARLVCETGITPQITTGILLAAAPGGQIGAGVAHQPADPFRQATIALADALG